MTLDWKAHRKWLRYIITILLIGIAASVRVILFDGLGRGTPYLSFYPAVMIAALYGGLSAGLLGTGLSALTTYYFIQQGFMSPIEWLAMAFFLLICSMISGVCEAMLRATARAKQAKDQAEIAKEQAEAANKAKSVFLANMSHELRTPLNAILGFSNLMRHDSSIHEEQRKVLEIINRSGEHLLNLINDVLDMAKIESGRIALENTIVNLDEMVRDIINLMRERAEVKGLQLELTQSTEFPRFVRVDATKLFQSIINLISNAVKYTLQGGVTLRLGVKQAENSQLLAIEVEDTGIGITTEDQKRIFDSFYQVANLTTQKGTGLGLAITRQYVELMGGQIGVTSTPGKGSKFTITIPFDSPEESELASAGINRGRVLGLAPNQPEYRILIVEDQEENWLLLQRMLENVGFRVRIAENGALGIEKFLSWRPDFIWMDIRMPVMDGLEAARRIRQLGGGREVKIAALTASVFQEERDKVLAAGMDDFICKPFRSDEVFNCLARHLGICFVYEAVSTASINASGMILSPEALKRLPKEVRSELGDAVISLDKARITEVINCVSAQDQELGGILAYHADQLQYTAILQALRV
jgi:signal transduction histidine kinase/CheY-like chemotaxis protein